MYNYFASSWGVTFITICVWTSGCKLISALKFPNDFISLESCINEGLISTLSRFSKIFEEINGKTFSIKKLNTENNELYGSVKPTEISKTILETVKLDIKPSLIQLTKEIKALGVFKVKIDLHSEVQAEVSIKVVAADTIQ